MSGSKKYNMLTQSVQKRTCGFERVLLLLLLIIFNMGVIIIITMIKLLDADWLRRVQLFH